MPATQPHPKIYFATVDLNEQVHMQALGFTSQFYKYVWAETSSQAEEAVALWAANQGCNVRRVRAQSAVKQGVQTYTFPEQILNLPKEALLAEYDRREYPDALRAEGQYVVMRQAA